MKRIIFVLILMLLVGMFLTGCQVRKSGLATGPTSTPTSVTTKPTALGSAIPKSTAEPSPTPTGDCPPAPTPPYKSCTYNDECGPGGDASYCEGDAAVRYTCESNKCSGFECEECSMKEALPGSSPPYCALDEDGDPYCTGQCETPGECEALGYEEKACCILDTPGYDCTSTTQIVRVECREGMCSYGPFSNCFPKACVGGACAID